MKPANLRDKREVVNLAARQRWQIRNYRACIACGRVFCG